MRYQTPYSKEVRFKIYYLVEREKRSVREACLLYSIPRKTYYKWYRKDHGLADSTYHSRSRHPNLKLTPELKEKIELVKHRTNYGPEKMHLYLKKSLGVDISSTIIYRFYKRRELIRKPQKKLPWYEPMKERLVVTKPGVGVQFDVKYVWEGGRRYLFSAFDPYTESYFFLIFATKHASNAVKTFKKAERYFGFKVQSTQTDNGSEFRGDFHHFLERAETPHYFIPKSSPYWNAQVERVHKTIDDEYYLNPNCPWKSVKEWLKYYNEERIHLTLG
jgi:IS30 family transposase